MQSWDHWWVQHSLRNTRHLSWHSMDGIMSNVLSWSKHTLSELSYISSEVFMAYVTVSNTLYAIANRSYICNLLGTQHKANTEREREKWRKRQVVASYWALKMSYLFAICQTEERLRWRGFSPHISYGNCHECVVKLSPCINVNCAL